MKLKPELTSQLLEDIRQAIFDKCGEDPHHRFRIILGTLDKEKREAEVQINWGYGEKEIMGVNF